MCVCVCTQFFLKTHVKQSSYKSYVKDWVYVVFILTIHSRMCVRKFNFTGEQRDTCLR